MKWLRITESTSDLIEGQIFIAERRENEGWVVSDPDNSFIKDWVEDGVYEVLTENPFKM